MFHPDHGQCPVPVSILDCHRCSHKIWDKGGNVDQVCDRWDDSDKTDRPDRETWTGRTVFQFRHDAGMEYGESDTVMPEHEVHVMQWTDKQRRQLSAQMRCISLPTKPRKYDVIEVFSPPRFGLETSKFGISCLSDDLSTGWESVIGMP